MESIATTNSKPKKRRKSKLAETWRRMKKNRMAIVGIILFSCIVLMVLTVSLYTPKEMVTKQDYSAIMQPPSAEHIFGTDNYGRDLFARVLYGGRNSLMIGVISMISALFIGVVVGSTCGYFGGVWDQFIMRLLDTVKSIPNTMMALAIVAALGANLRNLMIAITISAIPNQTRLVRSAVLKVVGQEYLEAARAGGTGIVRIIFKHVIPNCVGVIIVQASMAISQMILQAAGLSFIGMGIQPPGAEWGAMLSGARDYMRTAPWLMVFPGLFIVLSAYSCNLIGDGLRDALDPRLKT